MVPKIWRLLILPFFFAHVSLNAQPAQQVPPLAAQTVTIQAVVSQVKEALANVQTTLANRQLPPLKSVKLTLQTVATSKAGAKLSFGVITIGGTTQKDVAQELVLELTPPKAGGASNISSESLTKALEDMIVQTAEGLSDVGQGPTPLQLSNLSVSLGFTVTIDGTAGGKITLTPITLDLSGEKNKKVVHKIDIVYGK